MIRTHSARIVTSRVLYPAGARKYVTRQSTTPNKDGSSGNTMWIVAAVAAAAGGYYYYSTQSMGDLRDRAKEQQTEAKQRTGEAQVCARKVANREQRGNSSCWTLLTDSWDG